MPPPCKFSKTTKSTNKQMINKHIHDKHFCLTKAAEILYHSFDDSKVATRPILPTDVSGSCLVLFNLDPTDTSNRADGFGSWINNGGVSEQTVNLPVTINGKTRQQMINIFRRYWTNSTVHGLERQEYHLDDSTRISMMYFLPSNFNLDLFQANPHGNAKHSNHPYQRMTDTTREKIKCLLLSGQKPIQIYNQHVDVIDLTDDADVVVSKMTQNPKLKAIQNLAYEVKGSKHELEDLFEAIRKDRGRFVL